LRETPLASSWPRLHLNTKRRLAISTRQSAPGSTLH
jgi:hypothetical protein